MPDSTTTVVIERVAAHPFLAEYDRKVILHVGERPTTEMPLFPDSGGNSRANLYRLDARQALLVDSEGSYTVDLTTGSITKDDKRRKTGAFIGSFDVDRSEIWRFIPSAERAELPTEFRRAP